MKSKKVAIGIGKSEQVGIDTLLQALGGNCPALNSPEKLLAHGASTVLRNFLLKRKLQLFWSHTRNPGKVFHRANGYIGIGTRTLMPEAKHERLKVNPKGMILTLGPRTRSEKKRDRQALK